MKFNFTKMHGIGNDYVYVNCMDKELPNPGEISKAVSPRHFSVGSDGLIMVCASDKADAKMRIFNADGSEAKMCGNGIRCVGKFLYDKGIVNKTEITVDTLSGIKTLKLNITDNKVDTVCVDMGKAILEPKLIPVKWDGDTMINEPVTVMGKEYRLTAVSMGNPHAVIFIDTPVKEFPLETYGPLFESHERFPKRTNTEFVRVLDRKTMEMRVWERGSAETLACGTGTCATAVAAVLNGLCDRSVLVHLLGGDLEIEWNEEDGCVYMTGPATTVFDGEITLPEGLE